MKNRRFPARDDYDNLVRLDMDHKKNFLIDQVSYAKVVDEKFPFISARLNAVQTNMIIELLNDTGSYSWGEFGTPSYD